MKEDIMLTSQITVHNNFILKVNTILAVEMGGGGHYGKSLAIFLWGPNAPYQRSSSNSGPPEER